jgi:hypothetical protein
MDACREEVQSEVVLNTVCTQWASARLNFDEGMDLYSQQLVSYKSI